MRRGEPGRVTRRTGPRRAPLPRPPGGARANAITNQVYFIDVNGVGPWGGGQSLAVDPEGRVLHQAGEGETFFTVLIEPGKTKRVREFGSLGLIQAWKQLRDSGMRFPPYQEGFEDGAVFEGLGDLKAPQEVP
ncbi:MAG: nitrilase-related carbon-nitrogen hydrolase [Trueperaceae bacterium]